MSRKARHFYEFDSFRLDPAEKVLFHHGKPVPLSPKLFDTLLVLVRESGHIVEKEELIKQVWPDTFVEENNLAQYISTLRRTLRDERHEQRYIETVPRRGYRFAASVRELWEENGEPLRAAHTRVGLSVKEETEEKEDSEMETKGEVVAVAGSPGHRVAVSLALLALTVLVAAVAFGFYQFNGRRESSSQARLSKSSPMLSNSTPESTALQAFNIKTFDPSVWPRSDDEIGVKGFVIEDFEDTNLVDGLKVELSDSASDNFGPTNTLPFAFNPDIHDSGGGGVFVAGIWDGSHVLINRTSRSPLGYADNVWGDVTFHLTQGASSFGFSLHEMDFYTELFVNGVSINNLKRLLPSGSTRGGYVRIDAAPGEVIYSVKVANHANTATSDALAFDHVAFAPLPR